MKFCRPTGGEVTRLSCRKCQKAAPSWSGLRGAPLGVVRPSAARDGLVELLAPQRSPQFDDRLDFAGSGVPSKWCTPAGTTIVSPAWL
jgi:hypothetical protein